MPKAAIIMMPTIALPTRVFLGTVEVCVLDADVLLEGGEVVGKEARGAVRDDPGEDDVTLNEVLNIEDFEATVDVPEGFLLVGSPFERKTPFF